MPLGRTELSINGDASGRVAGGGRRHCYCGPRPRPRRGRGPRARRRARPRRRPRRRAPRWRPAPEPARRRIPAVPVALAAVAIAIAVTVTPTTVTAVTALAVAPSPTGVARGRDVDRAFGHRGQRQGHLALRIDVVDPYLDRLAQRQHVFDVVDALAPGQGRELGDVQQAVPSGQHVDEGAELGDVDHLAGVDRADIGRGRVEDERDTATRLLDGVAVLGADGHRAHHAVVVDRDVRARLLLQGVDDLALGPDDLADLVDRDLHGDDLRGAVGHVVTGLGDGTGHDAEDREAGLLGLQERLGQDVGRQAGDLGVELEGGHRVSGTRHLEVHVTEGVLGAQDVGQGDVGAFVVDQAHGDSRHRSLEGHTGGHQRQGRAADRRHRRRPVGGEHVGDDTQGVGELLGAGHDGQEGPLGQQAVADLAALGAPHEAGLPGREGREVVVVHVALGVDRGDRVEHLRHAGHAEGGDVEHLGLAPLEQGRAVRRGEEVDLGRERADVGRTAAVDPEAVLDDALAHQLLGQRADGGLDLAGAALELDGQRLLDLLARPVERRVALGFRRDQVGLGDEVGADGLDPGPDVLGVVDLRGERHGLDRPVGGNHVGQQLALQEDRLADPGLGGLEALGQHLFVDLGRTGLVVVPRVLGPAGFHHHDGDVGLGGLIEGAAGDHQLEGGGVALLEGGMRDPGPVDAVGHPDGADRPVEGDARDHQGGRGGVDSQDVVGVDLVGAEDRADHVDLVAEAAGERRAERAVDQPAGQDGLVRALALPAEERAGDLPGGVGPLFDVDGQGEEVGSLPYRARGRGRG